MTYQEYMPVLIEGDCEKEKDNGNSWKKKTYRLSLAPWVVAWDRCDLALTNDRFSFACVSDVCLAGTL